MTDDKRRNRLAEETSPYLRQHADNPVDWYPWGSEALERARREDRPILLSIGYSACHWCHVMAHESFEDENTAAVMNERFVNVKVDREERPDLDRIYQLAHQMLTQRPGGWPLTVFLTPDDQTPFFAGTYFPNQPRHGMPAFTDLLVRVSQFFDESREDLEKQNEAIREVFQRLESPDETETRPSLSAVDRGREELADAYDPEFGGFGGAPKFPQPGTLEFLLRERARHPEEADGVQAGQMTIDTLRHMVHSGLYDPVGGGFFRYCVDERWEIPHFEKMLYDNGPLLGLCAQAWQLTGEDAFHSAARATADWCLREMQSLDGGFYATLDADSDGREGGFYLWDPDTVREQLPSAEWKVVSRRYGLDRDPNFEGLWHLQPRASLAWITEETGQFETDVRGHLEKAAGRLAAHREETRTRPARDEKVLTAWNGLMIRGLATAGLLLNDRAMIDGATRAVDFVYDNLWHDGRLSAVWKDGRARFTAYLDDYAFLAEGLFELLQARWRDRDMRFLEEVIRAMLKHFHDDAEGGFFFTADDHEKLIHRPRPFMDESTPSGNGAALRVLTRLGHLTGESDLLSAAEDTLRAAWSSLTRFPQAHGTLLCGLIDHQAPGRTICLGGPGTEEWKPDLARRLRAGDVMIRVPPDAGELPGMLADRCTGEDAAWVCRGTSCRAAVATRKELRHALDASE